MVPWTCSLQENPVLCHQGGIECIMIGDSLTSDMLGAKNAALQSVWFMPSGDVEKAMREYDIDYCASSFSELYGILQEWASAS